MPKAEGSASWSRSTRLMLELGYYCRSQLCIYDSQVQGRAAITERQAHGSLPLVYAAMLPKSLSMGKSVRQSD